jgi:hypothetical protein
MAQLVGDWLTISDNGGDDGDTITAIVTAFNTGRNSRSVTIEGCLVSDNTVTATATFTQQGVPFITIDHFEDSQGNTVTTLAASAADYFIVGYANVAFMTAEETTSTEFTDMNDAQGRMWDNGFTIIEGGNSHTINMESSIQYGTDEQYMFRIPFYAYANSGRATRRIYFYISDDDGVEEVFYIDQTNQLT